MKRLSSSFCYFFNKVPYNSSFHLSGSLRPYQTHLSKISFSINFKCHDSLNCASKGFKKEPPKGTHVTPDLTQFFWLGLTQEPLRSKSHFQALLVNHCMIFPSTISILYIHKDMKSETTRRGLILSTEQNKDTVVIKTCHWAWLEAEQNDLKINYD